MAADGAGAAPYYFTDIPATWGPSMFPCGDDEELLPRFVTLLKVSGGS